MLLDKDQSYNILIIKIAAIGDLLLMTPALRVLKRNFPKTRITLLVGSWSRSIIEGNPYLDEIIEVPDEAFFKVKLRLLIPLLFSLRKQRFDLVFVWHRSFAFRFFSWLLSVKYRIGFSRRGDHRFLTHYVPENPGLHEVLEYQSTLGPIGINDHSEIDLDLAIPEEARQFAEGLWQKFELSAPVVVVAPGGAQNPKETMPLRHWPKENFAKLLAKIVGGLGVKVILLGGKNDFALAKEIAAGFDQGVINLCGQTTLKETAAVIQKADLFIGNDSSPMHISTAVKTPALSFFGPTDPLEKAPLNYKHHYFYKPEKCSPCYQNGRFPQCVSKKCLWSISVDEVFAVVAQRLKSGR